MAEMLWLMGSLYIYINAQVMEGCLAAQTLASLLFGQVSEK